MSDFLRTGNIVWLNLNSYSVDAREDRNQQRDMAQSRTQIDKSVFGRELASCDQVDDMARRGWLIARHFQRLQKIGFLWSMKLEDTGDNLVEKIEAETWVRSCIADTRLFCEPPSQRG